MRARNKVAIGLGALGGAYLYTVYAARRFEDLEPDDADVPGSFIDVDGTRVHYVEAGRGEPVVLIHGLGASTFSFRYTIPELAQHFRVVALDLRGFGYSERGRGDHSLTGEAELVAATMERLEIERAVVVGHSMGGAVAMHLALRHPGRVSRLVLVDSATERYTGRGRRIGRWLRPLLPVVGAFTVQSKRFHRLSLRSAVHDPAHVTPGVEEGYFRPMRVKGHLRSGAALLSQRERDEPLAPERITQPTLVLWGEHDRWLPPQQGEELAQRIPNASLMLVRAAGHLPLEEQPEESNRLLLEFLRSERAGETRETASSREA